MTAVIGDRSRKSKFDPDLAARVNREVKDTPKEVTQEQSGTELPKPQSPSELSLDEIWNRKIEEHRPQWQKELDDHAKNLPITEPFEHYDISRAYTLTIDSEVERVPRTWWLHVYALVRKQMDAYVEKRFDDWGFYKKPSCHNIIRKELLDKIIDAGESLMASGPVTNRRIATKLGITPNSKNLAFIRGLTLAHYQQWGWTKTKQHSRVVYEK